MIEPDEIKPGVISCLYNGIWKKIEFAESVADHYPELFDEAFEEAVEAFEFFKKHCVVSATFLEKRLRELREKSPAAR